MAQLDIPQVPFKAGDQLLKGLLMYSSARKPWVKMNLVYALSEEAGLPPLRHKLGQANYNPMPFLQGEVHIGFSLFVGFLSLLEGFPVCPLESVKLFPALHPHC